MSKVTALNPQQKNPQRFNLFVDGQFYCGVDEETIAKFKIAEGKEFTQAELEEIFSASEAAKVYQRALDFLAFRPRSAQELRQQLRRKIYQKKLSIINEGNSVVERLIDSIVARLEKIGYLDDKEFVLWWIEQRTRGNHPSGYLKIQSELRQKGVDAKLIDLIWQEQNIDEQLLLRQHFEVVRKRYDLSSSKEKQRLIVYLQRKGFRWELIKSVLE